MIGASVRKRTVRRPSAVVSPTVVPGAIGVWSASVVTVRSAVTHSASPRSTLRARALSSSSFAGRSSGSSPCLRRFARSCSRPSRDMPSDGVISVLSTKVPFSTMRVSGRLLPKPRCSSVVANVIVRCSPGAIGGSNR
jgi:hypothetical protein